MDPTTGPPIPPSASPSPPFVGPAEPSVLVCMWDGAVRSGSHSAGGIVFLNHAREVLWDMGVQFPLVDDPIVTELLVLREAISWCLGHGFLEMRFEGDAKVVIDNINKADVRDNRMGAIL
ncbi:unnamed protein product [Linum trigynum]|uniref:RNase H type-1 domain-containing protein n=1 Tax=Linum trigynum TaxID=586398 RepID=A0AAV2DH39_9ROSI